MTSTIDAQPSLRLVAPDAPHQVEALSDGESFCHLSRPPSPLSSASSSPDSSPEGSESGQVPTAPDVTVMVGINTATKKESLPPGFEHADKQAHSWCAALRNKKVAMENLLKAQRSLEKIEVSITQYLSPVTIEGTHERFLSALDPSNPEASYLLTIGRAVVHPLASRMNTFCVKVVDMLCQRESDLTQFCKSSSTPSTDHQLQDWYS